MTIEVIKKSTIHKDRDRCSTCYFHPSDRPLGGLYKDVPNDVRLVANHCESQTRKNHVVTPVWKNCCGVLDYYSVNSSEDGWKKYRDDKEAILKKELKNEINIEEV